MAGKGMNAGKEQVDYRAKRLNYYRRMPKCCGTGGCDRICGWKYMCRNAYEYAQAKMETRNETRNPTPTRSNGI